MADPVIMDDGGSTRIRHHRSTAAIGSLQELFDVAQATAKDPFQSRHEFPGPSEGLFTKVRVVFVAPDTGQTTEVPVSELASGDKIEIFSGKFTIRLDIGLDAKGAARKGASTLTVIGTKDVEPQVEAKQVTQKEDGKTRRRLRYLIANAPPIDRVKVTKRGVVSTPFSAGTLSVYTMIHVS